MLNVKVDGQDPTDLYEQVAGEIRRAIADGEAKPGERLPHLAQKAGPSRLKRGRPAASQVGRPDAPRTAVTSADRGGDYEGYEHQNGQGDERQHHNGDVPQDAMETLSWVVGSLHCLFGMLATVTKGVGCLAFIGS